MLSRRSVVLILGATLVLILAINFDSVRSLFRPSGNENSSHPAVYAKLAPLPNPPPNETLAGTSLTANPLVKILSENAGKILTGFVATSKVYDLEFAGSPQFVPEGGTISYSNDEAPKVQMDSKEASFTFDKETHQVIAFFVRGEPSPPTQLEPTHPKWTSNRALEIGTAYRDVLVGSSKVKFGAPNVKFKPPFGKGVDDPQNQWMDYHEGEWSIIWGVLNEQGIPFGGDQVWVRLSEKRGIFFATCYIADSYVPEKGEPMSAGDAIAIAKRSRPSFGTQREDIVDYSIKSCDMEIIHPSFEQTRPSRLAWVIWLKPIRSTIKQGPTYDDSQCVVVDAHNGEIIAINAML